MSDFNSCSVGASALSGVAILAMVYRFSSRHFSRATAAFGVIVLATSPLFFAFSRIVILDATLQDMSGYQATRALKSLRPAPRVLMMTFLDTRFAKLAALAAGADGLVATPEIPQRLLPKIAELFAPAGGLVETTQDGA